MATAGDITAYGGPITYLILQSLALFVFLVWYESGSKLGSLFRRSHRQADAEDKHIPEAEVVEEREMR